jgi:Holliday junction DNA helicase RuvA
MISFLRGTLLHQMPPELVLDVQGVGYEVFAPMSTHYQLSGLNTPLSLYIQTQVREDAITLYGFATQEERHLFRQLLKVNGVGAKMALAILSGMSVDEFVRAVGEENITQLMKLPGVGKKTAERLVIEMRDRLKDWPQHLRAVQLPNEALAPPVQPFEVHQEMAAQALESLGYKPIEARNMIRQVDASVSSVAEMIRAALQKVAKV